MKLLALFVITAYLGFFSGALYGIMHPFFPPCCTLPFQEGSDAHGTPTPTSSGLFGPANL